MTHKGFPQSQPVIEAMIGIARDPRGRGNQSDLDSVRNNHEAVEKYLKGLRVTSEIPNQPTSKRTYKIVGLSKPARENMFEHENPDTKQKMRVSVDAYFKAEKKYTLRYPDWPCLWVQPKERNLHIPAEVCDLVLL